MPNALKDLQRYGQSVWLDYIRRSLITGGELKRLIDEDGLRGVTSNPAIFEKAIAGSPDYEDQLKELTKRRDLDAKAAYEILAVRRHPGRRRHPQADLRPRPGGGTATSASRSRPIWPTTPRARSTRRGACGRPWPATT